MVPLCQHTFNYQPMQNIIISMIVLILLCGFQRNINYVYDAATLWYTFTEISCSTNAVLDCFLHFFLPLHTFFALFSHNICFAPLRAAFFLFVIHLLVSFFLSKLTNFFRTLLYIYIRFLSGDDFSIIS